MSNELYVYCPSQSSLQDLLIELNEAGCLKVIQNSVLEDTLSFRTCDEVLSGVDLVKFDNSEIFLL